jgi:hypothetical protein
MGQKALITPSIMVHELALTRRKRWPIFGPYANNTKTDLFRYKQSILLEFLTRKTDHGTR